MKKSIITTLAIMFISLFSYSQKTSKNITLYAMPYVNANVLNYVEGGAAAGVDLFGIVSLGGFAQKSANDTYVGGLLEVGFPSYKYKRKTTGLVVKAGQRASELDIEAGFYKAWNLKKSQHIQHRLSITFRGISPSISYGLRFGSFAPKKRQLNN